MRIFITGEKGFIGRNLAKRADIHGLHFVSGFPVYNIEGRALCTQEFRRSMASFF